MNDDQLRKIRESLTDHIARWDTTGQAWEDTEQGIQELVWKRQQTIEKLVVPWIQSVVPMAGLTVIEPGCGNGSTTAAFAATGCRLSAYEVDEGLVRDTRTRLDILGIQNVTVEHVTVDTQIPILRQRHPYGVDVALLIGILEHIKPAPRLDFLRGIWGLVKSGGVVVVAHSPNLFTYTDLHVSRLPFAHMLPDELGIPYARQSPHAAYRSSMAWAETQGDDTARAMRHNMGTGVSYLDFQVAWDVVDIGKLVADDGMGSEMMAWYAPTIEERLLWNYMQTKAISLQKGFSRQFLNIIFRKP